MDSPEIVAVIHRAIDNEKRAIHDYLRMAKVSRDVNAKNVLINLALDEVGHMNKLEAHLSSLLKGKEWVLPKATEPTEAAVPVPSAKLSRFDEQKHADADEIQFLQLAIDKEILANRGYLKLAESARTPETRGMFLTLAKEEEMHAKILQAEVDAIGQTGFWFDMQEFTMEQ